MRGLLTPQGLGVVDVVRDVADAHNAPTSAVALAWLLHQETVTAPLASATNPDQLAELVTAAALHLSIEEMAALTLASATYA